MNDRDNDTIYLDSFLAPLADYLERADVTDIWCNRPHELWLETLAGQIERHDVPHLTPTLLERLARQIAAMSAQGINRQHPLLASSLPDGSRVQIIMPPATRGDLALAIRKHVSNALPLSSWKIGEDGQRSGGAHSTRLDWEVQSNEFLRHAVRSRKNIVVSGGTSSGKTTLLNSLIAEIPQHERLIFIEDTPELQFGHQNAVGLIAVRGQLGEAAVSADDLLIASLRMRPDRIILGETRGVEALTFLRAINTGHPGSLTSIHANSPEGAIDQLALLAMESGARISSNELVAYIRRSVDLVAQVIRDEQGRRISRVLLVE